MRHRFWFLGCLLIVLLLVGMAFAQDSSSSDDAEATVPPSFEVVAELGRALPRSLLYDPNFERYLIVDAYGRLLFQDALSFEVQKVLYQSGGYNDYAFSHDGRFLALAIEQRIELWDTQSGERIARLTELGQPLQVIGAVQFSRDDRLLIFQGVYPAPRSIRVRENQTVNVPWIWHIPAALGLETGLYPGGAEAWQFFDYRNGMVIAPDKRVVAALPSRLQVFDGETLEHVFDIPTDRYETEPMTVWFSARDEQVYVRPVRVNSLIQVNTQEGVLVEIPLERVLSLSDLELLGNIQLSQQSRLIGDEPNNPLKTVFFPGRDNDIWVGETRFWRSSVTVTLVDLVVPPISTGDNINALLFVYDEDMQRGFFRLTSGSNQQLILNPDDSQLIARRNDSNRGEIIATYDLDSGEQLRSFIPSLRGIGGYSRGAKNRVLAFDASGTILVSDFQRYDAETNEVLVEDLRYSRRFDSFYFSNDSQNMVTLSGDEWRVWDIATGEVIRREVLRFNGSVVASSSDGYRFLTRLNYGMEIVDLSAGGIERESIDFASIAGSSLEQVYYSPDWRSYLVVYGVNPYGYYTPGNQLAMYRMGEGQLWFIAGDDLPPPDMRQYGFMDNDRVYIIGNGVASSQPERVYGAVYDASGVPACIVEAYPEALERWQQLWERQVYYLRPDKLNLLANLICGILPETVEAVESLLLPTATPLAISPTAALVEGVPACLTAYFANAPYTYAGVWTELTNGMSREEIAAAEILICEGIGEMSGRFYPSVASDESFNITMIIDAEGLRATGSYTPVQIIRRPLQPVYEEFQRTEQRSMGIGILSPDSSLVAASNLPGELVIYRFLVPYDALLVRITETSQAIQAQQNLVYPLPSHTPDFAMIGTARPTLTPTVIPTLIPLPEEREAAPPEERYCPSETLYSPDNLPEGYAPEGALVAPLIEDVLWRFDPITGQRLPDETLPQCGEGITCYFSPSRDWILAYSTTESYVIRPNGTDFRLLYGEDDFKPTLTWAGSNILEFPTRVEINGRLYDAIGRDILGVFPDPEPYFRQARINEIQAEYISRQPGGDWALARIPFSTGTGLIYQYYLYNMLTGEAWMFERYPSLNLVWHPLGDYLYYSYSSDYIEYRSRSQWFEIDMATMEKARARFSPYSYVTWSNEGRYQAYSTSNRAYPIAVYDTHTGLNRSYCVPETGARTYAGSFVWSPDSRYLALRAPLPEDEADEGVGQHLLILDTETGAMVDVSTGLGEIVSWIQEVYP